MVKSKNKNSTIVVEFTKSELKDEHTDKIDEKDMANELKKKTLKIIKYLEEEDYKKGLEIEMYQQATHYTKLDRDKILKENEALKARNELLEKGNANNHLKDLNNELKKDHLTESRKEQLRNEFEDKKRALFESQGIMKYLNDPAISAKKKQKL